MTSDTKTVGDLVRRYQALEGTCRLWIAAADAKDERILELTTENDRLHQRLARLTRRLEHGLRASRHERRQLP
jgi:hypothetical protein